MKLLRPAALCAALLLPLTLTACGDNPLSDAMGSGDSDTGPAAYTLKKDGPGACFTAVREELGPDIKVYEVESGFEVGADLTRYDAGLPDPPKVGDLTTCIASYQDPKRPKKLLQIRLGTDYTEFDGPNQLELNVIGDAAEFRLEDHLVPLSAIDTKALARLTKSQQKALNGAYTKWAWVAVSLRAPDFSSRNHELAVDATGRLKSNDVLERGSMSVALDGSKILSNGLVS